MSNEELSLELYNYILNNHRNQIEDVFGQSNIVEISPDFLGFIEIYNNLSKIIPKEFIIIDFGCGYNAQSFYFKEHKKYIGIDFWPNLIRFQAPNTELVIDSIKNYIEHNTFDIENTFAICSYVPNWECKNRELIRLTFDNCFTFYPPRQNICLKKY